MIPVIDASVVLALFFQEPGHHCLDDRPRTRISAVNWSEVQQKAAAASPQAVAPYLFLAGVEVVPFTQHHAELAASIWPACRPHGLSLADRACLALGMAEGAEVLTADREWTRLGLGIPITCIR